MPGTRTVVTALAVLIVVPLLEIVAFIGMAYLVGLLWALLLVLLTSAAGGLLVARTGSRAFRTLRASLAAGRRPGQEVTDGALLFAGSLLILVPGFLTDLAGALLLVPVVRRLTGALASRLARGRLSPDLAAQMFGPRRVRVRRAHSYHDGPAPEPTGSPLEGEIVEPRQH
jgi:UPF0716 protein FxsA